MEDTKTIMERLDKEFQEHKKAEEIVCPYCDSVQDNETRNNFVSYWGEDGETECICENCNETFLVEEQVERQFKCRKLEDEKD